jgi:hypothetical protein
MNFSEFSVKQDVIKTESYDTKECVQKIITKRVFNIFC